jgi:hypothetical protein
MKVLLCAIVKNENRYLNEWLGYYKNLGFAKVILYDNNDTDGEQVEHSFGDFVDIVNFRGRHIIEKKGAELTHGIQEVAYNDCYLNRCKGYDWVAFFDVDEYLVLDDFTNIVDFLSHDQLFYDDAAIQFNWEIYGDNGHLLYKDSPLRERFVIPSKNQTEHVKTILRTENPDFISMRCHWADLKNGRTVYPCGKSTVRGPKQPIDYTGGRIKHYFTKTIDEWIDRKYKGTSATGKDYLNDIKRRINEFFSYNELTAEKMIIIGNKLDIETGEGNEKLPVIVSLTSYKERFNNLPIVIRSIYKGKKIPQKVVLTLFDGDMPYITDKMKEMQEKGIIEIQSYPVDLKPHLKYFPTMMKYRNMPIVTIDDDIIYSIDLLSSVYEAYLKNENCVIARRSHKITYTSDGKWADYGKWEKNINDNMKAMNLCPTGVGGVLYPPDILKVSEDNIREIKDFILTDDLYLKLIEYRKNIPVVNIANRHTLGLMSLETEGKRRLYDMNVIAHNNDEMIKKINGLII